MKVKLLTLVALFVLLLIVLNCSNSSESTEDPPVTCLIGEWQSTSQLSAGRSAHTCESYNNFVYVIGGTDGSSQYDLIDVQYTNINNDGTLNNWQSTTSFPVGRSNHISFVDNAHIYLIGGWDTNILFSSINADGTLGNWDSTSALPEGKLALSSVVHNNYVYILGGFTNTAQSGVNGVFFAEINPDGTLSNWQTTTSFQHGRYDHSSVVHNNTIYIIGGDNSSNQFDDVQYAQINSDGTIGEWKNTTSLPNSKTAHTSFVYDNYLFVIGGYSDNIVFSKLNQDGTIGEWQVCSSSFQNIRGNHTSIINDSILYLIGGWDGSNLWPDVQFANLN